MNVVNKETGHSHVVLHPLSAVKISNIMYVACHLLSDVTNANHFTTSSRTYGIKISVKQITEEKLTE